MRIIGNNPAAENAEITAVASGALANGDAVIVNSDGTVSVIEENAVSQSVGSPVVFESATTDYISSTFDSTNNKVVISYKDDQNSNYGTAVVGTVSGTSISFGTPVVFHSDQTRFISSAFDSNEGKVVIVYRDDNNDGDPAAIVGTVSGTSISFGGSVFVSTDQANNNENIGCTFDSNENKVVISWSAAYNSSYGTARVGTVSGTSISFGTAVVFESASTRNISSTFDSLNNKVVISYRDDADSDKGKAVVGTVSGTSISFGAASEFEAGYTLDIASTFDTASNKVVTVYKDVDDGGKGKAVVGAVSGTSISFGTPVVFEEGDTRSLSVSYDANAQKVVAVFRDFSDSSNGKFVEGTVSGSSITFGSATTFNAASTEYVSSVYDSNSETVVISYHNNGNSSYGTAVVLQPAYTSTTLTSENFIGFANGAAADTGKAKVDIGCAINDAQSGLTAGQTYYVQTDGTLGLTAADPSVIAGTAISATEIIVKG